jgi:23S rRNA (cytidine2498-2'-O)-methyltransferase
VTSNLERDTTSVYVAAREHMDELCAELETRGETILDRIGRLVFARGATGAPAAWAQNTWLEPRFMRIDSIADAARKLRAIQRNWHWHPAAHPGRARLVGERLPVIRFKPVAFPAAPPTAPLGAWTLLEPDLLVASAHCSSPFPDGEVAFVENRSGPPNRAYLKLWEALTLARRRPGPGARCLDLGAAPGGWTWVLATLGADVMTIDRAPLADALATEPRIAHRRGDAFKLRPAQAGELDWIFSDVAAYPRKLLGLAREWAEARPQAAMIFSVKLQGPPDPAAYRAFLAIAGSRLVHLAHNRHELTWFRLPDGGPPEGAV